METGMQTEKQAVVPISDEAFCLERHFKFFIAAAELELDFETVTSQESANFFEDKR